MRIGRKRTIFLCGLAAVVICLSLPLWSYSHMVFNGVNAEKPGLSYRQQSGKGKNSEQKIVAESAKAKAGQSGADKISLEQIGAPVQDDTSAQLQPSDFPSPSKGKILRSVGNYYSDGLQAYIFHGGNDYAEPEGAVIRTLHGGKVIFAGADPILGNKVVIDYGQGWQVTYGCLENLRIKTDEVIAPLSALGQVGFNPGADSSSSQTQLHYEVWHNNENETPK